MKQAIVIVGGYNSLWPVYLEPARYLEDVSGLPAVGVPLMPWHWWSAMRDEDATTILHKLAETVTWAQRRLGAGRVILVGHSAGGVVARLYLCDQPVWGQVYAGVEQVTDLTTLGSPHCPQKGTGTGWFLSEQANRLVPGATYAGRVRYRTVAGRYMTAREDGGFRQRQAWRAYRFLAGQDGDWGDGVVPVVAAALDGAENVILEGVSHSLKFGPSWYCASKAIIRRWWLAREEHGN